MDDDGSLLSQDGQPWPEKARLHLVYATALGGKGLPPLRPAHTHPHTLAKHVVTSALKTHSGEDSKIGYAFTRVLVAGIYRRETSASALRHVSVYCRYLGRGW
jgi:hypothetical protein